LPSYKKCDLSLKLPFVVVFQTSEIERLSEELEALRVALKDSEKQTFNCQSYEIQIRELTDQCHEYDVELAEYRSEVEKLNVVLEKLYEELEDWKSKYQDFDPQLAEKYETKVQEYEGLEGEVAKWRDRHKALERSKDQELEDLKLAMESQRKSMLNREMNELNVKFENERNHMQGQIRKMQEAADTRDEELTQIKFNS
jgi:chromosome segregation ATPase